MAKKKKKLKKRIQQWMMLWLLPVPVYVISRLLFFSLRKELRDCDEFMARWKSGEPMVAVLWHNREILAAPFYLWIGRKPVALLASQSFDGLVAYRIFRLFRADVAWGSSTRGGEEGLKQMIEFGKKGHNLALTPDGPQGPVYKMKPGAVRMASETGLPIYTLTWYAEKVTRLKSWDRWMLPHPFTRALFMSGKPIHVPPDADEDMIMKKCREVEDGLNRISRFTEKYFGNENELDLFRK